MAGTTRTDTRRAFRRCSSSRRGNDVTSSAKEFVAYVDGGARGNPGPAGWGAVLQTPDGDAIVELHGAIAHATNNVAEYQGLIAALTWALEHGATALAIKSDSLL